MRRCNISGTQEIREEKNIDAGRSKSTRALTRDQQYIFFGLIIIFYDLIFRCVSLPQCSYGHDSGSVICFILCMLTTLKNYF